ncbi:MAG: YceI family protein [Catalinimonas sp.]
MQTLASALLILLLTAAPGWTLRPDASTVQFNIRNAGLNVEGSFEAFSAAIRFAPDDLANSSIRAEARAASIETGIGLRDKHLRGEDYFDAERYPTLRFESERIERRGDGYVAVGRFTVRDVTKTLELPFTYEARSGGAVFKTTFEIDRRDYGVGGRSLLLSDDVEIVIQLAMEPAG